MSLRSRSARIVLLAVLALVVTLSACGGPADPRADPTADATGGAGTASTAPTDPSTAPAGSPSSTSAKPTSKPGPRSTSRRAQARTTTATPPRTTTRAAVPRPSGRLPLALPTGSAARVITVTAPSTGSTTGTLQAWQQGAAGWARVGPAVTAWLGSAGLSAAPRESMSATPMGSFTLTQAFGRMGDPGTALPYRQTTPADWWISEPGPLYNTLQRCSGGCGFTQGDPNEHLYYETPYYDYAVVIDYNTANSPTGVRQGAGSAFFLHVTVGEPTAGCVAVPRETMVRLLQWLTPAAHPRILIGLA